MVTTATFHTKYVLALMPLALHATLDAPTFFVFQLWRDVGGRSKFRSHETTNRCDPFMRFVLVTRELKFSRDFLETCSWDERPSSCDLGTHGCQSRALRLTVNLF